RAEPSDLLHLIAGGRIAVGQTGPIRKEHDALILHQDVLHLEQLLRLDPHLDLFRAFPDQRLLRVLVPVDVATGHPPEATARLDIAEDEEDTTAVLDQRGHHDLGVAEENAIALRANTEM